MSVPSSQSPLDRDLSWTDLSSPAQIFSLMGGSDFASMLHRVATSSAGRGTSSPTPFCTTVSQPVIRVLRHVTHGSVGGCLGLQNARRSSENVRCPPGGSQMPHQNRPRWPRLAATASPARPAELGEHRLDVAGPARPFAEHDRIAPGPLRHRDRGGGFVDVQTNRT